MATVKRTKLGKASETTVEVGDSIIEDLRDQIKTLQSAIDDLTTNLGYEVRNLAQAIRELADKGKGG